MCGLCFADVSPQALISFLRGDPTRMRKPAKETIALIAFVLGKLPLAQNILEEHVTDKLAFRFETQVRVAL